MVKFVGDFLFGLAFGMGFCLAYGVLMLLVWVIAHAHIGVP